MNAMHSPGPFRLTIYFIGTVLAFLAMGLLIWWIYAPERPAPLGYVKGEERRNASLEVHAVAQQQLETYGVIDAGTGQVRLPIDRAMEWVVERWQDPETARQELIERREKFHPPPPPADETPDQ